MELINDKPEIETLIDTMVLEITTGQDRGCG
jgi:hypothetical protein